MIVSWVQGMALQWGVEANVKEDCQEMVKLKRQCANFIKELIISNDSVNQNYGTIKLKLILSRMDEQVRFKLARKLSIENGRITVLIDGEHF